METALQRLAREITIMRACGGPLSQRKWMAHVTRELADVQPLQEADLRRLAMGFDGCACAAELFIKGLEVSCASFVVHPSATVWAMEGRTRATLDEALDALVELCASAPALA
jgi:hypothetical protein